MPAAKVKEFLDRYGVRYVTINHSRAYTAAEVAESAHVAARDFAKTIVVMVDGETSHVRLATEAEFRDRFPDCELGAMPPFGNLYGMRVFVSSLLAEEPEIAFNAGTHTEVLKLRYEDFAKLVKPVVLDVVTT